MNMLEICNLNIFIQTSSGKIHPARDISFTISSGENTFLIGESGSGKTIIFLAVAHLLPPSSTILGNIYFQKEEILQISDIEYSKYRGKKISIIPQNAGSSLDPLMKCGNQIFEILDETLLSKREKSNFIIQLLKQLGFNYPEKILNLYPHELSGGMQQRVISSIALASKPKLLIADEPTKGLDFVSRSQTIGMFFKIQKELKTSLLVITHDLEFASLLGNYIAVIYSGEIVEYGPKDDLFTHPFHPYTRGLIAAHPKNGLKPILGVSPNLNYEGPGCLFYDRCPIQCNKGSTIHPKIYRVSPKRDVRCHQFSK